METPQALSTRESIATGDSGSRASLPERLAVLRYGAAIVLVVAGIVASSVVLPYITPSIFVLLFPTVVVAAWFGGFGPGILASVLAALGANMVLLEPVGQIAVHSGDAFRLGAFLAISLLVSWLTTAERAARRRVDGRAAERERLARQLQEQSAELEKNLTESQQLQRELERQQVLLHEAQALQTAEQRRLRFLGEASRTLASSLDYHATLRAVAEAFVPDLSDWCVVHMLVAPGSDHWPPRVERVAVAHEDRAALDRVREVMRRTPLDWNADFGLPRVLRTGEPAFLPEITDEMLRAGEGEKEPSLLRRAGVVSYIGVPIRSGGEVVGAITLAMSASGRHYTESDLELAEEVAARAAIAIRHAELYRQAESARTAAEEANRAKTEFLAVMSHELRTPLNAIGGYAQLIQLGIRGPINDQQKEDLERIQRSARHLLSLINQILNFTRLHRGDVAVQPERVSLRQALADMEELMGPQLAAKGVRFERDVPQHGVLLWCDPEKLQQILLNLLSNARKFTPADGTVALRASADGNFASILVEDTGPGIPPDKLESIFEPFVQLDRGLTSTQEGTGLGLAISRELARAMGGDLRAELGGVGARFRLTVPLARDAGGDT